MNIKYFVLSAFVSSIFWGNANAQSANDGFILSSEDVVGSARIKSMGNVQTALGGDISSINGNPAGLGFFSKSDASITFSTIGNKNKTNFLGQNTSNNKNNFGVDQAGVVFAFPSYGYSNGWQNFNVGVSYNKSNNYTNTLRYAGINNNSSIANALSDIMFENNSFAKDFINSNIVEEFENKNDGFFPIAIEAGNKDQYNNIETTGNKSKTSFSFGANYNNVLYIGASVGISSINYKRNSAFSENGWTKSENDIAVDNSKSIYLDNDPNNKYHDYVSAYYRLNDYRLQNVTGSGFDFKLGMILKPAVDWNIGFNVNTPTVYTIQDDLREYTEVNHYDNASSNSFSEFRSNNYDDLLDYKLTTPWKVGIGVTKFFNTGLITADAELVTNNTTKYSTVNGSKNYSYQNINNNLRNNFKNVVNVRVGGEYLFTNAISGRAGFNYFGNPYKNVDFENYNGSIGLGFKFTNNMYLDLAVVVENTKSYTEQAYAMDEQFWKVSGPVADIKTTRSSGLITIGAKF